MVPKVSLELVVATHHYSYFPNLSIPLSSGGCFGGSTSTRIFAHKIPRALSLYQPSIFLAYFVCYSPYLPVDSCGFWVGVDLIEMVPMISFSASQATEPRHLLVWGAFCVIAFLTTVCLTYINSSNAKFNHLIAFSPANVMLSHVSKTSA